MPKPCYLLCQQAPQRWAPNYYGLKLRKALGTGWLPSTPASDGQDCHPRAYAVNPSGADVCCAPRAQPLSCLEAKPATEPHAGETPASLGMRAEMWQCLRQIALSGASVAVSASQRSFAEAGYGVLGVTKLTEPDNLVLTQQAPQTAI